MRRLTQRIRRAATLDVSLYEEVETDPGATGQAVGVVVLSSLAAGIGMGARGGVSGIVIGTLTTLLGWYAWAYLIYFFGSKFFPEPQTQATHGELLRTTGFSSAPGLLRVFGIIPGLTGIVFGVSLVWMLVTMVIAVRQALDYTSTLRAAGVCVISLAIVLLLLLAFAPSVSSVSG
ncbi:MAG TPA: YIP1 family protein [Candidatus Tectomicrobia bacterium]|jgi:hypothetical protein